MPGVSREETHGGEDVAVYARVPGAKQIHGVVWQKKIFDAINATARLAERADQYWVGTIIGSDFQATSEFG